MVTMDVQGAEKLDEALSKFDAKLQGSIIYSSLKDALVPIKEDAIAHAPEASGATKASIKIRSGGGRNGIKSAVVGVGQKWFTGPTFYAAFTEFGHLSGSRKTPANKRHQIPGLHYIENAYKAKAPAAVDRFIVNMKTKLEQAAEESKS